MTGCDTIVLGDDQYGYTFGGLEPVAKLRPGVPVTVFTQDCFGGLVTSADTLPSQVCDLSRVNPVTGPFHVEGARPGDTLAVHLISIRPARPWGVSATFPHFGALTATHETAMLHDALPERVWRYELDLDRDTTWFHSADDRVRVELPLQPMHGTIGVAPGAGQAITTLTSGPHGGNLDTPLVRAGATVYFGVNVEGALFGLGDGHARQGDGELCGVGIECAMRTTFVVDVIKGRPTAWPRIETDTHLMSIGAVRPLEDAYRIAHRDMTGWLAELSGMDELDAMQLLSQAGQPRIGNVVDPAYTIIARYPKNLLPGGVPAAYDGAHARLRGGSR